MEGNKICSFFGHRDVTVTDELYNDTSLAIMQSIEHGCTTFYFGGFGDFDDLCYKIVSQIMIDFPHLKLKRIYCVEQEKYLWKKSHRFNREDYEDVIYLIPSFESWYKCIYYRNCAMIDESDYIIFYAKKSKDSGAYKAYKYAIKQHKTILNLYDDSKNEPV